MKTIITIAIALIFGSLNAQNINIPDANFKTFLLNNSLVNTNADTEIQLSEAQSFSGELIIHSQQTIVDLTGLENFTSMTKLNIYQCGSLTTIPTINNTVLNQLDVRSSPNVINLDITGLTNLRVLDLSYTSGLTSINVSQNPLLFRINIQNTNISTLDVSANTALTYLFISSTPISTIDLTPLSNLQYFRASQTSLSTVNFSNNSIIREIRIGTTNVSSISLTGLGQLRTLRIDNTSITTLDLTPTPLLTYLDMTNTQISSLNTTILPSLNFLDITSTNITSLDVSSNKNLTGLEVSNTTITGLNLDSNVNLDAFEAINTGLTSIDLSNCGWLYEVYINNNDSLNSLNIANGNNPNLYEIDIRGNQNLTCAEVDDPVLAAGYTDWYKDSTTSYSINCSATVSLDETSKSKINIYPNPTSDYITINTNNLKEVLVYNHIGNLVISSSSNNVDLTRLPSGVYTLRVILENEELIRKVLKH